MLVPIADGRRQQTHVDIVQMLGELAQWDWRHTIHPMQILSAFLVCAGDPGNLHGWQRTQNGQMCILDYPAGANDADSAHDQSALSCDGLTSNSWSPTTACGRAAAASASDPGRARAFHLRRSQPNVAA